MTAKRLELLRQLLPTRRTIAVLSNPTDPNDEGVMEVKTQPRRGTANSYVNASSERDFEAAFAEISEYRAAALFVIADPLFTSQRARLVALAEQNAIPASYAFRDFRWREA